MRFLPAVRDGHDGEQAVRVADVLEHGAPELEDDAMEAARNVQTVVTDVWISMGDDEGTRAKDFSLYQVNADIMAAAAGDAIFMHCLPAIRGMEVTADVIDGPQSVVFDEAENRLHAQKAIMAWCAGGN